MLLATDLDGTFLGGRQSDRMRLYRFLPRQPEVTLVFVTGRGFEHVLPLIYDPTIPTPKYVICDVGTTIVHGDTLEPVQPIQSEINQCWPGEPAIIDAIEPSAAVSEQVAVKTTCRTVDYRVKTADGEESKTVDACQSADGAWQLS